MKEEGYEHRRGFELRDKSQTMEGRFDEKFGRATMVASWGYEECKCGKDDCECGKNVKAFITSELHLLLTELVGKKQWVLFLERNERAVIVEDILSSFRERGISLSKE